MKMSSTHFLSLTSHVYISTLTKHYDIDTRLLPIVTTSTKMDPNQSDPLKKLHISLERDLLQHDTSVLMDPTTILSFGSQKSLN
jgi:hypothetical protein